MSESKGHFLLLAGSPKPIEKSGAARRGSAVIRGLEERGWTCETLHLHTAVRSDDGVAGLLAAADRADVIALAAPLYVDSLPAPTLRALDRIAAHRRNQPGARRTQFASIVICGFNESSQNASCQRLLEQFALRARFEWIGGVSFGGGGGDGFGKRRIQRALELLVESIDEEILLSSSVDELTEKPAMPRWLYILGGNAMWKKMAKANGVAEQLRARPYERSKP